MNAVEDELYAEMRESLEVPDEPAASAMGLGMDESGVPEPDRVRIVAVFDPVSTGFDSGLDGMEDESFDEPMETEMQE